MTDIEQMPHVTQAAQAAAEMFDFSSVAGFRLQDFDYRCPSTTLPCDAKMRLISQYTAHIDEACVENGDAQADVRKLNLKLGEYTVWGMGVECTGSGTCQIRKAMDESVARQTAVRGIRGVRRWFKS